MRGFIKLTGSVLIGGSGLLIALLPYAASAYSQGYYESSYYTQGYYYTQSYYQGSYSGGASGVQSQLFTYTGGAQTFTVPVGVTSLRVVAVGGGGGGGAGSGGWGSGGGGGCGGGIAGSTLAVTPGASIAVTVGAGGAGGNGSTNPNQGGVIGGPFNAASNGQSGGVSSFASVSAAGGGWGRSGFLNLYNTYAGGSGGGSGGGGGGNGWPGFYEQPGQGGTAGNKTNSQGAGGYCTGSGWNVNLAPLITKVSYTPGSGGYAPGSYVYWGGGGGGGLVINNSSVRGSDGPSSSGNGGAGYGGGGGGAGVDYQGWGGSGAPGAVYVEWNVPPASCTLSLSPTTIAYGGSGATLSYSSANAASFSITKVGNVIPNTSGSVTVYSAGAYTGTVYESDGTPISCTGGNSNNGNNGGVLTVTPPPAPTATISTSAASIHVGQSATISATFGPGSGDTLTHDNIDSPAGTGLGATTNPDASKSITFTPSVAGTYTFYARAQTSYYPSWATYASVTVTVTDPPSCTPAYSCVGDTIQYTDATCDVSSIATCTSPNFCSTGSAACISPVPVFNASGNLSGHLQALPSLVPLNVPTTLYWDVSNVAGCTVSGSNGDSWTGAAAGAGGKTSTPLIQQTVFTLACTGLASTTISESITVNLLPVFQER